MKTKFYLASLLLGLCIGFNGASSVLAQGASEQGTPEQRQGCESDAMRLCSAVIPDADRIAGCLRQNEAKLTGACRAVLFAGKGKKPGGSVGEAN